MVPFRNGDCTQPKPPKPLKSCATNLYKQRKSGEKSMRKNEVLLLMHDVVNALFLVSTVVIMCSTLGLIEGSRLVLTAYWLALAVSPVCAIFVLVRWIKKWPEKITWLRMAFGVDCIIVWIYAGVILMRFYTNEEFLVSVLTRLLVAPVILLSGLALYLCYKAYKNKFKV